MQSITHASQKKISVNRSNRQTLSLNGQQHARCKRSHQKWNQREREKKKKCLLQVCLPPCWLVLVMTAGRASGPGRQDCGRREASLRPLSSSSCDGRLIVGGVALGFGGAEHYSVGNCSPTVVFTGRTSLLGSAFLAVIVSWLSTSGILCVDSPVILWSSSCCW